MCFMLLLFSRCKTYYTIGSELDKIRSNYTLTDFFFYICLFSSQEQMCGSVEDTNEVVAMGDGVSESHAYFLSRLVQILVDG